MKSYVALVVACLWCLTTLATEVTVTPDPSVLQQVSEQTLPRVAKPLKQYLVSSYLTDSKGTKQGSESLTSLKFMENGLLSIVSRIRGDLTGSRGFQRDLSLCGLLILAQENSLDSGTEWIAPDDHSAFLPTGIKVTPASGARRHMIVLETNSKNLCTPQPDAEFQYSVATYEVYKGMSQSSIDETSRTQTLPAINSICKAGSQRQPASQLSNSLQGEYLPVTCYRSRGSSSIGRAELAFLTDSGIYLLLASINKLTFEYKYSHAQY